MKKTPGKYHRSQFREGWALGAEFLSKQDNFVSVRNELVNAEALLNEIKGNQKMYEFWRGYQLCIQSFANA